MLPTVENLMFREDIRWDANAFFDWDMIKKEWMKYWDLTKPILLEKSPPNIIRVDQIVKAFTPSYIDIGHFLSHGLIYEIK